jgi:ABC-type branched-subunit amino acid transport system ATPase component/ABC-type branched-subunit amino acid transport system permease subunit
MWLFPLILVLAYHFAVRGLVASVTVSLLVTWLLLYLPTAALNIIWGYAGQLSLAYAGIVGVSAYASAVMLRDGRPIYLAAPVGVVVALAAATLVAKAVRRTTGSHYVIATFAMGLLMVEAIKSIPQLGGTTGIVIFNPFVGLPRSWTSAYLRFDFILIACVSVIIAFAVDNLARSPQGRTFIAVRENPTFASSVGVAIDKQRRRASLAAAIVAGLAGALYAVHFSAVDPTVFAVGALAFNTVLAILIGGRGTFWGPILGSAVVACVPVLSPFGGHVSRALMGVVVIVAAIFFPAGVVGAYNRFAHNRRVRRVAETAGAIAKPGSDGMVRALADGDVPAHRDPFELRGVSRSFGPIHALKSTDLTIAVGAGETIGVAGPNGAGKSTLLSVMSGALRPDGGTVSIRGHALKPTEADHVKGGVVRVAQSSPTMPAATVIENLKTAIEAGSSPRVISSLLRTPKARRLERRLEDQAAELAHAFGIAVFEQHNSGELSYGNRRLLSIAAAVGTQPDVLLLDEPSAGLSPASISRIQKELQRLASAGYTLVVVDHRLDFLASLTDRIVMMREGRIVSTASLDEHMRDTEIAEAYLGTIVDRKTAGAAPAVAPRRAMEVDTEAVPLLRLDNVCVGYGGNEVLTDVTTAVPPGVLVAWLGPNGAGKTTLGACAAGTVPAFSGDVQLAGRSLQGSSAWQRARAGLAFVAADRHVFPRLTVRENLTVGAAASRSLDGRRSSEADALDVVYATFPVLRELSERAAAALSGGQQQMVVTARALMGQPQVLILDEPFAGLAPVVCDQLAEALRNYVEQTGISMVLIDQDVTRVAQLVDRMVLLASGRLQIDGPTDELLGRPDLLEKFLGVAPTMIPTLLEEPQR